MAIRRLWWMVTVCLLLMGLGSVFWYSQSDLVNRTVQNKAKPSEPDSATVPSMTHSVVEKPVSRVKFERPSAEQMLQLLAEMGATIRFGANR